MIAIYVLNLFKISIQAIKKADYGFHKSAFNQKETYFKIPTAFS